MGEDEVVVEGGDEVGAEVDMEIMKKMVVTQTGVEKMVVTQTGAEEMVVTQIGVEKMVVTQTGAEVGDAVDGDIVGLDMEEVGVEVAEVMDADVDAWASVREVVATKLSWVLALWVLHTCLGLVGGSSVQSMSKEKHEIVGCFKWWVMQ